MLTCIRKCCSPLPQRYVMAVFLLLGLITCYLMRVCLNVAINEMTFKIKVPDEAKSGKEYCEGHEAEANRSNSKAEFHWDQHMQHNIIKSIYIGYILAHIPAGVLADLFGGKHVIGGGILISSILSLLFPLLARFNPYAFMAGRVVEGFGQGVMFPSVSALIAKWAPPNERSIIMGIVQSGVMLGNTAGFMISGVILDAFSGWEPIFYFCGVLGLVWCLFWYSMCYSSPADHPFISEKEKDMIESQIALTSKQKPTKIPWKGILTSAPFLALIMVNFGHSWAIFTMINEMATYMNKVLHFNIKKSGIYAALPYLAMVPTAVSIGFLSDWLISRQIMSITTNRRLFGFLANTTPIPFMLGASFAGCDSTLVIILLMIMMFLKGQAYSTTKINPVDLSPNYAGVLMGFMNGSGAFAGLISPQFTPMFLTGDGSVDEWRNVFYLAACVMFVFSVPYLCLGSGEPQPWNSSETTSTENTPRTEANPTQV